jgi:uncharacterized integral membrane protein
LVLALVLGALVAAFAVLNLDQVKVHWIFATGQTPLIVVVLLAFALGIAADRLAILVRGRRKRRDSS